MQTLAFLYELLMHREGDIRRQAAALMGEIIAGFHAGYAKERPADSRPDLRTVTDLDQWRLYLEKIIYPDHKLMPQHRGWIRFTLKFCVKSLLSRCPGREERFLAPVLAYLRRPEQLDDQVALQLLDAAADLPLELCTRPQLNTLLRAAEVLSGRESLTVQAAAMLLLDHVHTSMPRQKRPLKILQEMDCGNMSLALLREDICAGGLHLQEAQVSDIFLDNLKTATPWIIKQVNLRLLTDDARNDHGSALHIATHLSNLIKVSDRVTVRHSAGLALLEIAPRLTVDQRNEVSVELCRGLELGQQEFTKYIPDYLGRFALWLPPEQLDECLADLGVTLSASSSRIVAPVLDTVGVIYEEYDVYHQRFPEEAEETCLCRRDRLLGMLMRGLAGIDGETRQEAMLVLGQRVFGSAQLSSGEKSRAFP